MKKFLPIVFVLLLVSLSFSFALPKKSLAQSDNVRLKVFVHEPREYGRPIVGSNCTQTTNDTVDDFGLIGWHMPVAGMTYKINLNSKPANLSGTDVTSIIGSSFGTWHQADSGQIFIDGGVTTVKSARLDGTNAILWKGISGSALAITYSWYYTNNNQLAESDTVFNRNYKWTATSYSGTNDCDGVAGTYDLQNIATHEFGHWAGLDDLYSSSDKDLTMYGYGETKELKKDSLGTGDALGVNSVQP